MKVLLAFFNDRTNLDAVMGHMTMLAAKFEVFRMKDTDAVDPHTVQDKPGDTWLSVDYHLPKPKKRETKPRRRRTKRAKA